MDQSSPGRSLGPTLADGRRQGNPRRATTILASLSGAARSADNLLSLAQQQIKEKADTLREEWEQEASKLQANLREGLEKSHILGPNGLLSEEFAARRGARGLGRPRGRGRPVRRSVSTSSLLFPMRTWGHPTGSESDDWDLFAALQNLQQGAWTKQQTPQNLFFSSSPTLREQVREMADPLTR
jgi:hypothetical protein